MTLFKKKKMKVKVLNSSSNLVPMESTELSVNQRPDYDTIILTGELNPSLVIINYR